MKRIILFGDSITAGYAQGEITPILTNKIKHSFSEIEIINAGIPGNTSSDGLERLERNVLCYQPDLVILFFGANDLAEHHFVTGEQYRKNLQQMLFEIGTEKSILCTPPYTDQRKRSVDRPLERICSYTEIVKELGKEYQVPVIPLLEIMLDSPEKEIYLQEDGLHFSAEGYQLLSQLFVTAIKNKEIRRQ